VHVNGDMAATALSSTQMASLLYSSGNKRAAKELLCEQREVYVAFRSTATPCMARADWELKGTPNRTLTINQALTSDTPTPGFRASTYKNRADCLTAAYTAHVPLSACDGK
jgi:hypothetical protein